MRLNVKQKNWLLSLHITSGGLWFGTALCSVALALGFKNLTDGDVVYGVNLSRNLMGQFIIVPSAILSVITGVLLCGFTNWGFFKHNWVIVKQAATLVLIVIGSVLLGPWTKEMTTISEAMRSQALLDSHYISLQSLATIIGSLQTIVILAIIVIATVKPWSRKKVISELNQ